MFLSQRYGEAHNDLRNLAPIHNQVDGPCHEKRAHGKGKAIVATRLYLLLGKGNPDIGRAIVIDAWVNEWAPKIRQDIPLPVKGVRL